MHGYGLKYATYQSSLDGAAKHIILLKDSYKVVRASARRLMKAGNSNYLWKFIDHILQLNIIV